MTRTRYVLFLYPVVPCVKAESECPLKFGEVRFPICMVQKSECICCSGRVDRPSRHARGFSLRMVVSLDANINLLLCSATPSERAPSFFLPQGFYMLQRAVSMPALRLHLTLIAPHMICPAHCPASLPTPRKKRGECHSSHASKGSTAFAYYIMPRGSHVPALCAAPGAHCGRGHAAGPPLDRPTHASQPGDLQDPVGGVPVLPG